MHTSVLTYVGKWATDLMVTDLSVLDVGGRDVNGTTRPFFTGPYLGIDLYMGPGVDALAAGAALPFGDECFRVVVCTEVLEHDTRPWRTVAEVARVLVPGGIAIMTARGYDQRGCFPIHDHPGDYWRFSVEAIGYLLLDAGMSPIDLRPDPEFPGVLTVARKNPTALIERMTV